VLENAAAEILEGGERGTPFDERQGIEEDLPKGLTGASAENKTHGATLARDQKRVNDWPGGAHQWRLANLTGAVDSGHWYETLSRGFCSLQETGCCIDGVVRRVDGRPCVQS
jgi:hypothetical protein